MQRANQTTMLKSYEKEISWKAGAYAIAVHLALLGGLLISFNWKAAHPVLHVAEVELWESIPNTAPPLPSVTEPEVKQKVETQPVVKEMSKPEEKDEVPKVDIALENKKEPAKKLQDEDKRKKDDRAKLSKMFRDEDLARKEEASDSNIRDIAKQFLEEDSSTNTGKALAAKASANKDEMNQFIGKIQNKIKGNVNNELCGDGNPQLVFKVDLLPSGELSGSPKLAKTSGIEACDDAVERAILASQPLPLPDDVALKSQFRNLELKFKPNE